jgi:ribokinase
MMKKIVVVGSMNMDLVTTVAAFPKPGETIHSLGVGYFPGGKGANQAVAAARSGASVQMIGAVGTDSFAQTLIDNLAESGVDTSSILRKDGHSGLAVITVEQSGENQIVLAAGSNKAFTYEEIGPLITWDEAYAILLQNEINWETTVAVMKDAKQRGVPVWFNPAPALKLEESLLPLIHTCILNETEIELITGAKVSGAEDAVQAAKLLLDAGVTQVIVTLGDKGCVWVDRAGEPCHVPAFRVKAVDTTAAGDTFIGALASASCEGLPVPEALRFAVAASALAVTRQGAQASIPTKQEIEQMIADGHVNRT